MVSVTCRPRRYRRPDKRKFEEEDLQISPSEGRSSVRWPSSASSASACNDGRKMRLWVAVPMTEFPFR